MIKRKKNKKKLSLLLVFLISFIIISLLSRWIIVAIDKNIEPTVSKLAESKARYLASSAISSAMLKTLDKNIKYSDFIEINRTNDNLVSGSETSNSATESTDKGKVVSVSTKMFEMNQLAAILTSNINQELNKAELKNEKLKIPLGVLLNSPMFVYMGPRVNIDIIPTGAANVNFQTEFSEAGINQTRYRVYLNVNVNMNVIVPFISSKQTSVQTLVPVAETVIVGPTPQSFVDTNKQDYVNLLPK